MKILLYTEGMKTIGKSGLGKAILHQMKALDDVGVSYTTNVNDDYDILHINTYFPKSYFFAKKAKKEGKKIVYNAHSTEEDYKDGFIFGRLTSKLFRKWIIKCYKLGDVIVTPTEYSKRLLSNYEGLENKKIFAISNGIDTSVFKCKKEDRSNFIKKYGCHVNDKIIVGIGLYIRRKGIIDFINLAKRFPQYKFIWFGYSNLIFSTCDVRRAFKNKPDNLIFAGYTEREGIREALSSCDLYLFPTYEETEGIPIIEACCMKCNSIVRNIPIFDFLVDGKHVYKVDDIDSFCDKIEMFFDGKLQSLSDSCYEIADLRDIKKIGVKLKEVYNEVNKM